MRPSVGNGAKAGGRGILLWVICSFFIGGMASRADAQAARRVLIVHSFGNVSPPSITRSIAFETKLTEGLGAKVDLDEVSLDHARYGGTEMEEALVEYLRKRQAQWQPDLVVPIGAPACQFVNKYRERLFPQTPVIYTGIGRGRAVPITLTNAAYVGEDINVPGLVDDILQIAPDTTNVVCVIGSSQIEQYWEVELQHDFARFTNHVGFTWMNELSFDQVLERVQHLPPHSFILLSLLNRDATGVTHNANEALKRITEVANAPVNGVYEDQLGLGVVGGHLYRAASEGDEAARIAIRILKGESPSNFPPELIPPTAPEYDWRQLQRWKISEERLPPGSIIKFRQPTVWEQHLYLILGSLLVVMIQSALIAGLVASRSRRRKAEAETRRWQQELAHVSRLSTLWVLAGSLAHELRQPLAAIVNSAEAGRQFIAGERKNDAEVLEALDDIAQQGRLAGDIITQMRAMLKRDSGKMEPQDLNLIVRAVIEMVHSDLVSRQVTPVLRLDPLLPSVKGHGVQLRQAILNLVLNACDAMAERSVGQRILTIESKRAATDDEVEISVADTGRGFSKDLLRDPFEPFRTTKPNGLGLGLAISQSIVTAHDGRMAATNNNGSGATIKLTLPEEK